MPVYVTAVFAVSLSISLIAFALFWRSPARNLAVEVQEAKEDVLQNPFYYDFYTEGLNVDIGDGILQVDEIEGLLRQAEDLADMADPATDFTLADYQIQQEDLEF